MIPDNACCFFCGAADLIEEKESMINSELVNAKIFICKGCLRNMNMYADKVIISIDVEDSIGNTIVSGKGNVKPDITTGKYNRRSASMASMGWRF